MERIYESDSFFTKNYTFPSLCMSYTLSPDFFCGEKQNYLSGDIEGLEPGDRIVLALIDPITDEIYISDSTIGLQRETRIFRILGFLVRTLPHDVPPGS